MSLILAGDIGGTNTRLVAATCTGSGYGIVVEKYYASHACSSFTQCLHEFMGELDGRTVAAACFAVAGPVQDQHVKVTNLPWEFSAHQLVHECAIPRVRLLNDFEAVGYGVAVLPREDVFTLQAGVTSAHGLACVIGAGTGLGQATIAFADDTVKVWPGEGGHIDFAPRNKTEYALAQYWADKLGRVSNETFLSGAGIVRIFEFVQHTAGEQVSGALYEAMRAGDPAAAISRFALGQSDTLAVQTMAMFVGIYGAVAGNFALATRASAGVFIAGGIATKILPLLQQGGFIQAFIDKPPMASLLQSIPVNVVRNEQVGLLGAINRACVLAG